MATSDKSDKSGKQGSSRSRTTRATPRKKATRPPTIDLEATEVAGASGAGSTPPEGSKSKSSREKPVEESAAGKAPDNAPAEATGAKAAGTTPAEETTDKSTSKPDSTDGKPDAKAKGAPAAEPAKRSSIRDSVASLKPDPAEPQPTMAPQAELGGFSLIAVGGAAAAGALLSLAVLVGLDRAGVLPWRADNSGIDPAQITAQLEALESEISGLAKKAPAGDPALNSRVADLEKDLNTAGGAIAALPELIDTLASRLDGFETTLTDTQAKAQSALSGLKSIESAVDTIGTGEGTVAASTEALELKLSASDKRISEIAEQVAAIPEGVSPDAFTTALGSVRGAIETRLDTIEKRLGGPGETRGAASAIALASLRRAVDGGTPFASELAAFSALVPDEPAAGVVRPYAESGLMTRSELAARFATAIEENRRKAADKEADQDITGSILSRLQTVVKVRRTGEGDSSDAGAVMARMANLLSNGDLAGAVAQGNAAGDVLPVGPKDWLKTAQARLAADKALAEADVRMLAAQAKSGD